MTGAGSAAQGRRLLVATAVARYPKAPQWDRPGLATARQQVIDLFTGILGYTHVSDLGLDPTETQLTSICGPFAAITSGPRITWSSISPDTAKSWTKVAAGMCC
jgi:hypothetical protein